MSLHHGRERVKIRKSTNSYWSYNESLYRESYNSCSFFVTILVNHLKAEIGLPMFYVNLYCSRKMSGIYIRRIITFGSLFV